MPHWPSVSTFSSEGCSGKPVSGFIARKATLSRKKERRFSEKEPISCKKDGFLLRERAALWQERTVSLARKTGLYRKKGSSLSQEGRSLSRERQITLARKDGSPGRTVGLSRRRGRGSRKKADHSREKGRLSEERWVFLARKAESLACSNVRRTQRRDASAPYSASAPCGQPLSSLPDALHSLRVAVRRRRLHDRRAATTTPSPSARPHTSRVLRVQGGRGSAHPAGGRPA